MKLINKVAAGYFLVFFILSSYSAATAKTSYWPQWRGPDSRGVSENTSDQRRSDTYVLRAGPKHEVLQTNSLGEPVYASPTIAGGNIFIRGEKHLYAIGD